MNTIISRDVRNKARRIASSVHLVRTNSWATTYAVQGDHGLHIVSMRPGSPAYLTCDCPAGTTCSHRLAVLRYRAIQRGHTTIAFCHSQAHTRSFARALQANRRFRDVRACRVQGIWMVEANRFGE